MSPGCGDDATRPSADEATPLPGLAQLPDLTRRMALMSLTVTVGTSALHARTGPRHTCPAGICGGNSMLLWRLT